MPKKTVSPQHVSKKANIPKALREQVWIQNVGNHFEHKCLVEWCQNKMNVFDFHVGHNIPESRGGSTNITNLKPICARCNLSMGSQYSIEEWAHIRINTINKLPPTVNSIKRSTVAPTATTTIIPKRPWWLCC
jgi:5-methylcytosine-specific restriction endonuclease McrA